MSMSLKRSLPILEEAEVRSLLSYEELLPALTTAFTHHTRGKIEMPVRSILPVEPHGGFVGFMPAYSKPSDAVVAKVVSFFPGNAQLGEQTHGSYVMMFDAQTGALKAMLDGEPITTMRTAAASAIASKYLANPESRVLAILGSGVQARSHYDVLSTLYKFDEVRVWSRCPGSAEKFAAAVGGKACSSVQEATLQADIICTCTSATQPILLSSHVKDGAHVNAVGACRPDWRELEGALMRRAEVVVDSRAGCQAESGDLVLSKAEVAAEIGELITGQRTVDPSHVTVFDSVGMAAEDLAAAEIVYSKYLKKIQSE